MLSILLWPRAEHRRPPLTARSLPWPQACFLPSALRPAALPRDRLFDRPLQARLAFQRKCLACPQSGPQTQWRKARVAPRALLPRPLAARTRSWKEISIIVRTRKGWANSRIHVHGLLYGLLLFLILLAALCSRRRAWRSFALRTRSGGRALRVRRTRVRLRLGRCDSR